MSKQSRFPDNVKFVNFRGKESRGKTMRELYPDAFAMYVDTKRENSDEFSRAVLEALKLQEGEESAE